MTQKFMNKYIVCIDQGCIILSNRTHYLNDDWWNISPKIYQYFSVCVLLIPILFLNLNSKFSSRHYGINTWNGCKVLERTLNKIQQWRIYLLNWHKLKLKKTDIHISVVCIAVMCERGNTYKIELTQYLVHLYFDSTWLFEHYWYLHNYVSDWEELVLVD